jgi:Domain of unknown function (DUF5666)
MIRRTGLAACAVALFIATTAWAQVPQISGIVSHVDPAARIVYFADGRWVRLDPGTRLTVDGREITMEALKPGTNLVLGPAVVPTPTPPSAPALSAHPPIDASGVVAKVDHQTGIITFQDGRMVKVTDRTRMWQQPMRVTSVKPGMHVFVYNAQPIAFQFSTAPPPPGGRYVMGSVVRVDPAGSVAVLSDGTLVRITPATTFRMENQPLTIRQLQPGDQVVIWQRDPVAGPAVAVTPSTGSDSPSTLPRHDIYATIDADEIVVVRRPQSP